MQIEFNKLFNKHKNIPCVIFGASQSMMDFDYEKFIGIKISVGTSILRIPKKFTVDYLVSCNNEFPVPEIPFHLNFLNKLDKNTAWIMSDTGCYNSLFKEDKRTWDKLKINYYKYDDRHFNKKECSPKLNCCNYLKIYPKRETIFEALFSHYKEKNLIKETGTTVAEIGLVIALILGCNPIFVQGIDIPKTNYNSKQIGVKYLYGYPNKYADSFLDKTSIYLRKRYFFYYLRKLNFKPYILRLIERIRIGKYHSYFSLTNFSQSRILFYKLSKLAQKKGKKILILSKNSTLLSIKGFKYLDPDLVNKKFSKFFSKNKTMK